MTVQPADLRPLTVGEILDKAFRLYRANFLLFIGIAAILLLPFGLLQVLSQIFFRNVTVVVFLQIFLSFLLHGALNWATSRVYLGLPASVTEAYRIGRRRFGSIWGASFLQGLAYLPAVIVVIVGVSGGLSGVLCTMLFAVPYFLYLSTRWVVDAPSIIIEGLGASAGLGRSWALTSKDTWHVFGTVLTSGLLVYLVALLPGQMINFAVTRYGVLQEVGPIISTVITQLGTLISTPLGISAYVILYYDLRVRREGYDLELATQEAGPSMEPAV